MNELYEPSKTRMTNKEACKILGISYLPFRKASKVLFEGLEDPFVSELGSPVSEREYLLENDM